MQSSQCIVMNACDAIQVIRYNAMCVGGGGQYKLGVAKLFGRTLLALRENFKDNCIAVC